MGDHDAVQRRRVPAADRDVANVKLIIAGNSGAGKTALVRAFCEQRAGLPPALEPTVGADFQVRHYGVNGKEFRVCIWDVSGDPGFLEVRNEFYKDSQGLLLVCDVTSRKSFQDLEGWHTEMQRFSPNGLKCTVVGTKIESGPRAVNEQVARNWAQGKSATYFEVSTAMGKNIEAPFRDLVSRVV